MTWALPTIAVLLIGFAIGSRRLEQLNVSGAMFFTTAGLLVGPVLGLVDLHIEGEQVKLLAEITLTLVLFADASRISLGALRSEFEVPLRLLGIGLPLTIAAPPRGGELCVGLSLFVLRRNIAVALTRIALVVLMFARRTLTCVFCLVTFPSGGLLASVLGLVARVPPLSFVLEVAVWAERQA
jgi:hypothetical protein